MRLREILNQQSRIYDPGKLFPLVPSVYSFHFGKLTNSLLQFIENTFSLVNFLLELDSSNQQT